MRVRAVSALFCFVVLLVSSVAWAQGPSLLGERNTNLTAAPVDDSSRDKAKDDDDEKDKNRDYLCVYLGGVFGGNMFGNTPGLSVLDRGVPQNYGAALGFWGKGVLSGELDFAYYKDFFGPSNSPLLGENKLYTFTGSFVINPVSIDFGTQRIRPYVLIGGGLMRAQVQDFIKYLGKDVRNWGVVDLGAGVQYYPVHRIGVRADLRYFRAVGANESEDGWGFIDKWDWFRGSVGVAITF